MYGQRDFVLLAILAAAIPAFGQTVAPVVGPGTIGAESAASSPDFSGIWTHQTLPGFELPLSGPGPVVNKSREPTGETNLGQLVGDFTNPILKPQAAEVLRKSGEIALTGVPCPTPRNQCWPGGVPFMFSSNGIQILQQADKITILYDYDHEVRRVRLNQSHPEHVNASWYGDSVGRYEGETLVIDTVGVKVGPFAMVDWYGTPHTEALHVVERYRLIDYEAAKDAFNRDKENVHADAADADGFAHDPDYRGNGLQLQFTVEDGGVFTMPWSATITYRRPSGEWLEYACAENLRATYVGKDSAVPRANKPDF
jgi:hypothetical protein